MGISKPEIQQRMARFDVACLEAGVKRTQQRMEIFREVAAASDHPGAEEVYERVRKRLPTVSLDTVYRTLWLLNDLGLITTLGHPRRRTQFDANLGTHHHFVCVRCGLTRDFDCDDLTKVRIPKSAKALGRVERTQVEVRGVCSECAAKEETANSSSQKKRRENQG